MLKKRIPYGISNFEILREKGYVYVDKTKYIEILENLPPYQFFIRPRRFGKSLFVATLENYYDINKKDKFEALFGDLYIGKNPTPEKNSYLIFRLDFSALVTNEGKDRLIQSFDRNVLSNAKRFMQIYGDLLNNAQIPPDVTGAEMVIEHITNEASVAGYKVFILIDEYDNFANNLIGTGNRSMYEELISGEGYIRTFYKAIKSGTTKSVARVFMTGVSPIMLDDLTSGFNITSNLTMKSALNEMMGFTQQELKNLVQEVDLGSKFDQDKVFDDMKRYYNGYMFNEEAESRLYNADMVLYFIEELNTEKKYPKNMIDNNVKTDYNKLRELAFNFKDEETVERIIKDEELPATIVDRFRLEDMYTKKENFISLLYYMGMLTIKRVDEGRVILGIPNYVVKTIYWEYFLNKIDINVEDERLRNSVAKMRAVY